MEGFEDVPLSPDIGEIADGIMQMAETFGGQRRAIVAQGFTGHQAAEIVVSTISQFAANSWKEVGLQWGLPVPEQD